ncbi:CzcE family metal-binding protein [Noviherbaspirillum sedimenti]|uniref:CzcE family metal-binding protein n=1 Tax=Noviherbaspirillum sedimenti TaxID=2320865 RepID=A0A3A3G4B0_9BURK|nr:CzcE family metal-binding protein [Noviherbaspirillum sedimenti]RJG03327.1 hypothetical protein D3878_18455 [Noviherbaspirillum sedimenti]
MKKTKICATALGLAVLTSAMTVQAGTRRLDLLGERAPEAAAQRTVVITPATRHVRVEGGEIVKFVVGDRAFTWQFNGPPTTEVVKLNRIVPPGVLDQKVTAYVDPDPRYLPN